MSDIVSAGKRVLVLDCSFQPVGIISWEKAVTLLFLNKAMTVESYNSNIRSQNLSIMMPKIIRLVNVNRRPKVSSFSKESVLFRDRHRCAYCGDKKTRRELTIDHVIPRCLGGPTKWDNVVASCHDCNSKKGGRTPKQAQMDLLWSPKDPGWDPIVILKISEDSFIDGWENYIKIKDL